jgi:class 3 adenylate cyclase
MLMLEGARQRVTVLCGALAKPRALIACLSPEDLNHLLHTLFTVVTHTVDQYEGIIRHFTDTGFVALFGVPTSHEDHAVRALLAAVGLQQGLRKAVQAGLPASAGAVIVQMGVHTGYVIGRRIGHDRRLIYMALGDTLRLATRLQRLAAPDTIILSDMTARFVRGIAHVEAYAPVSTTGKARAIPAYTLVRLNAPQFLTIDVP